MKNEKEVARIEVVMTEKREEMHGASIKVSGPSAEVLQLLDDLTGALVGDLNLPAGAVLFACATGVSKGLKTHEADR